MIQKCFTLFDRTSCLTVIYMQCSERICCMFNSILKLDRNHADKTMLLKYTQGTTKTQRFALIEKKLFGP